MEIITTKKCPFCAEEIKIEAKKCKHCGEYINIQQGKNTLNDPETMPNVLKFILVFFFIIVGLALKIDYDKKNQKPVSTVVPTKIDNTYNFKRAVAGEFWEIQKGIKDAEKLVPLMSVPDSTLNEEDFKRKLILFIKLPSKIEILETKSGVNKVYLYNENDKIINEGWLFEATVGESKRLKKSYLSSD